jgi:hypothetical protein
VIDIARRLMAAAMARCRSLLVAMQGTPGRTVAAKRWLAASPQAILLIAFWPPAASRVEAGAALPVPDPAVPRGELPPETPTSFAPPDAGGPPCTGATLVE